jgi:hypothetical protein
VGAGDAELTIDAIPTGNEADSIDSVDQCAAAEVGDVFDVDVVVQDIDDLLAFEVPLSYNQDVLKVTDRNVRLFLEASGGQAFDGSSQTPNDDGAYVSAAVDTSDPLSPESGTGVLVRITMEAVAAGNSALTLEGIDLNADDRPDRGILLRNAQSEIIGDEDSDSFFDGPITDAEIRVGGECSDEDARVVKMEAPSTTPVPTGETGDDDDSSVLPWIIGAGVLVVLAGGAGGLLYMRSRRAGGGGTPIA